MICIVIACLLGGLVGSFCAIYVFGTRTWRTETFSDFLRRWSLTAAPTIVGPILAYFTLFQDYALKGTCLGAYFLSLVLTTILTIALIARLLVGSLAPPNIPHEYLKAYRRHLLLKFLLGGYAAIRKEVEAIESRAEKAESRDFSRAQLSEEEKRLSEKLKLSREDLKQVDDSAKRLLE